MKSADGIRSTYYLFRVRRALLLALLAFDERRYSRDQQSSTVMLCIALFGFIVGRVSVEKEFEKEMCGDH